MSRSNTDPASPDIISHGEVTHHFVEHSVWMLVVEPTNMMRYKMNLLKVEHGDNAYMRESVCVCVWGGGGGRLLCCYLMLLLC